MSSLTPIADSIRNKLALQLETTHLDVVNESYMHNVPKEAETHFKVVVVTNKFQDLALIKVRLCYNYIHLFKLCCD